MPQLAMRCSTTSKPGTIVSAAIQRFVISARKCSSRCYRLQHSKLSGKLVPAHIATVGCPTASSLRSVTCGAQMSRMKSILRRSLTQLTYAARSNDFRRTNNVARGANVLTANNNYSINTSLPSDVIGYGLTNQNSNTYFYNILSDAGMNASRYG